MTSFDIHQHLWPPPFVEALARRSAPPCIREDELVLPEGRYPADLRAHGLEERLALLDRARIDVAVVSLQPTLGLQSVASAEREELERAWEDGILEIASASGGRLLPLAPSLPRTGFAGASVGADAFDDLDSLAPLLDELRGSGFLFVHPVAGSAPIEGRRWWAPVVEYTSQMQRAYFAWLASGQQRWPDVIVVFAILAGGAPVQLERLGCRADAPVEAAHENVFLDISSYGQRAIRLCADAHGAAQLAFGTDAPVVDPGVAARALAGCGEELERLVREETPARLLARDAGGA
jgi:6-methylsalicylate decarboxylase